MKIKVPATIGGFGPGREALGLAFEKYLILEVLEPSTQWYVEHQLGDSISTDETNYIIAVALKLAPQIQPHYLRLISEIPLKRGLGSSTAALLAGIELANQLGELHLDDYTKLTLAARTEGQPAGVTAALLGGITTSYLADESVFASGIITPTYQMILFELADSLNRITPERITYEQAMKYGAAGNMLLAAWQNQQAELAGRLLESDDLVEITPVSEMLTKIRQATHALNIYGTIAVSDRIIMTLVEPEHVSDLCDVLSYIDELKGTYSILSVENQGLRVEF